MELIQFFAILGCKTKGSSIAEWRSDGEKSSRLIRAAGSSLKASDTLDGMLLSMVPLLALISCDSEKAVFIESFCDMPDLCEGFP